MDKQKIKTALSGAAAGAVNGFFGAGGGMVLVPLLTRWAKFGEKEAFATSVAVILPLSAVSAVIYFMRQALAPADVLPYLAGGLVGGFLGGRVFKKIPAKLLRRLLALFIIYAAVRGLL